MAEIHAALSRREALSVLLGAPLAAEACQRVKPRRYEGQIRGASLEVGHRLRSARGATLENANGPKKQVGIAIVGAGPSGLSAAWRLERLGVRDFVVLDLEGQVGGTSAFGSDGVVPYPWGAHYVPLPSPDNIALVNLLDEMGAIERTADGQLRGKEALLVRAPEERLFMGRRWHEGLYPSAGASRQDLAELRRFETRVKYWSDFRDAQNRPAFTLPMRRCSDAAELTALDRMSAADWLRAEGFTSKRLFWFVDYACRDDYGLALSGTSAWAMLFYFAARQKTDDPAPFLTWPEGNGRIVRHLASVIGPRLQLGQLVTDIVTFEDRVELSVYDARRSGLLRYQAEHVILAVPKFVAARIVRTLRDSKPDYLAEFKYGAWLVANLHLSRRPKSVGFESAWDNVLYDSPSLGYVVATHQRHADSGPTIWTYYHPLADRESSLARKQLAELDHAAIADSVVSDLSRAHDDLPQAITRIDAFRWGHAMVSPLPGFIWGTARRRAESSVGRVHFAHSDLSGIALFEEAQDRGVRAAEVVARFLGRDFQALG